ncbi:MAG: AI-2E family transporter [Thermoflexales bacterium]|nr:AI-2E family transporter [Thermoflexales bacterium]
MKRLAWFTLIILATLASAIVFWEFRVAVVLFSLSLAVAAAVRPLVDRLAARRVSRGLALLLAYALCVGGLIALMLILSGPLFANLQQLTKDLGNGYEQLKAQWPYGTALQQTLAKQLPAASDVSKAITGPEGGAVLQAVLGLTMGSFDLLGQLLIVLVLSMYWSVDQEHFKRLWLSLLPFQARARAREVWQNIETGFGAYLRSQVVQTVLALILLGLGYQVLGVPYPVALALIGAVGWLIPWVGVLIAVMPAAWVGLSISPVLGLAAAAFTIGVLAFLEFVVEPRLFKRERFSSLLAVIVLLVLADEYGFIGILVAPPLAAALQIFAGQIMRVTTRSMLAPAVPIVFAQPIEVLQTRLASVEARLAAQPEAAPELLNVVKRLTQLIDQAPQAEPQPLGKNG